MKTKNEYILGKYFGDNGRESYHLSKEGMFSVPKRVTEKEGEYFMIYHGSGGQWEVGMVFFYDGKVSYRPSNMMSLTVEVMSELLEYLKFIETQYYKTRKSRRTGKQ